MPYLIDTDWVIHHLNGRLDIIQRLQALQAEGLGLSVAALAELYEGVYYSRDPAQSEQKLNDFLESVTLVGIDDRDRENFRAGARAPAYCGHDDWRYGSLYRRDSVTVRSHPSDKQPQPFRAH